VDLAEFGPAVFATVDKAANIVPRVTTVLKEEGGLKPAEAMTKFHVTKDLVWEQLLHEPEIRQPLQMSFDERGRIWVVQYIQYPHPAGLKMVSRDNFWRAVYDKVPVAPPNHVRGKDKITIHEDTDGDGQFDKQKTFVEGLSVTTAVARGRGGVWVLNPPYLLFYPDKDNDDVPDGDPVVHLAGFGIEDSHSVTNSLRFGPDGWLYATQGSTVSAAVVRPGMNDKQPVHSMGQLVWRYHPETRKYEIFAEGGGNAFGLEMDSQGRIFSGHNGGDTRGFYYTQGAYLQKGFGKHGPLSNPYSFGYFPAMAHHKVPRFTHTFLIYEGGALPAPYDGGLFGCEPLQNQIVLAEITRDGSTFKTKDLSRPVTSEDSWFRPVDIKLGPDGAVYVADWYDGHVNHYRNNEGRVDPEIGRIYRLKTPDLKPAGTFDLSKKTSQELIEVMRSENKW
jgi:putative membrane-bound dehydrogenase-like protein